MKSHAVRRGLVLATTLLMLFGTLNAAWAWTISGTIYNGSNPLPDAKVTAYNATDQSEVGSNSTDASGHYSITVSNGSYNLSIAPSLASGLANSVVNGIAVTGADVLQNVILVQEANLLSGTVRNSAGAPASNIRLKVNDQASNTPIANILSDANGHYSVPLASGTYEIDVQYAYGLASSIATPKTFYIQPMVQNLQVAGNTTRDLTMPFVTLSGKTTDASGAAIPGVLVKVDQFWSDNSSGAYTYKQVITDTTSDASGAYSLTLIGGASYTIALTPPMNSNFANTAIGNTVINSDVSLNLVVDLKNVLSGVVRNPGGAPASNIRLKIFYQAGTTLAADLLTDVNGQYSVPLASGAYKINLEYSYGKVSSVPAPKTFYIQPLASNIQVTGATSRDLTAPFATLSGKTTDANGIAVPGVKVGVNQYWSDTSSGAYTFKQVITDSTSDASGNYSIALFAGGTYIVALTPPAGSNFANTVLSNIVVTADTARDLVVSSKYLLSGVVRNLSGAPVSNISLSINEQVTDTLVTSIVTDAGGHYSASLAPGSYEIDVKYAYGLVSSAPAPRIFYIQPMVRNIQIAGATTRDLTLPFVTLSGSTTDSNGVAVPGVQVKVDHFWSDTSSGDYTYKQVITEATSNAAGTYSITLIAGGSYSITIIPPAGSGFAQTVLNNQLVAQDTLQNIILVMPDTAAPLILSDPKVSSRTDTTATVEWQTNEPAKGGISYGTSNPPGTKVAETSYQAGHSLPLAGLSPNTTYYLQVSASDASGNGPTLSKVIGFRTDPTPDHTPPLILTATFSSITHTSAVVQWTTDEPSTGAVVFGLSTIPNQTLADATLATSHRLTLSGLTPETVYYFQATATDAAGNGPTVTPVIYFRTVKLPDNTPPVILEGPMAVDISDTGATIIWTTDEPASSGVSWNDGTAYGVMFDAGLTTSHSVRLAGLSASTRYFFTVSSKDAFDNGRLGEVASFTTLPAPDTKAPVVTLAPVVKNVNHQMALIYWETDEPADSVIEYGTTGALGTTDAHAGLLTKHNRPLTGLEAGTLYYFRVLASDVAGNGPTASQIYSFTTDLLPNSKAPVITSAPEIVYASEKAATVYFETDTPCDTVVEYGEGSSITNSTSNGEKVNKHQATITNLNPNTAYGVQVSCTDLAGKTVTAAAGKPVARLALNLVSIMSDALVNVATGGITGVLTWSTADKIAPVITSAPTATALAPYQATIVWSTDKIADSKVTYNQSSLTLFVTTGDIPQVFDHSVVLTNLTPNTTYQYTVKSVDPSGNPVASSSYSFTTPLTQDGSCGSASGGTFSETPAVNLCTTGTPTGMSGAGPWSWSCAGVHGGAAANCAASFPSPQILHLTVSGTGSGSVVSTPSGIAGNVGGSASFPFGTSVALHAGAADFSLFTGWLGDCSPNASGDCAVVMDAARSVTATFDKDLAHLTRMGDTEPFAYYPTLQGAYAMAPAGGTVLASGAVFVENLVADLAKEVVLKGGYSPGYGGHSGTTVLKGTLKIRKGILTVEKLSVRQ